MTHLRRIHSYNGERRELLPRHSLAYHIARGCGEDGWMESAVCTIGEGSGDSDNYR